jgi:hypothetical protein
MSIKLFLSSLLLKFVVVFFLVLPNEVLAQSNMNQTCFSQLGFGGITVTSITYPTEVQEGEMIGVVITFSPVDPFWDSNVDTYWSDLDKRQYKIRAVRNNVQYTHDINQLIRPAENTYQAWFMLPGERFSHIPEGQVSSLYNIYFVADGRENNCRLGSYAVRKPPPPPPPPLLPPPPPPDPEDPPAESPINPISGPPTNAIFDALNPLKIAGGVGGLSPGSGGASPHAAELSTPGGIISRLLNYSFVVAGMILFVMIVVSGFQMVAGATNQKSIQDGQQRATAAVVGFVILFCTYWIIQIVSLILGVTIL